jgi:hypothetical protein
LQRSNQKPAAGQIPWHDWLVTAGGSTAARRVSNLDKQSHSGKAAFKQINNKRLQLRAAVSFLHYRKEQQNYVPRRRQFDPTMVRNKT